MRALMLLARHAGNQVIIQACGFASGVLIVRALPKAEYAQYAVAVAVIAAVTMLSDSGISTTLMSKGATMLQNRSEMGRLVRVALKFKSRFGAVIVLSASAWLAYLLIGNDASPGRAWLYVLIFMIGVAPVLTAGVLLVLFRLELNLRLIQRTGLALAVARLIAIVVLYFADLSSVSTLLLVTALVSAAQCAALWIAARPVLALSVRDPPSADEYRPFRSAVRHTLPAALLLVGAEQILLALITARGTPDVLAELSAMSRFGVLFVLLNALVTDVIAPRFARLPADLRVVRRRYLLVAAVYILSCGCLLLLVWVGSPILLYLLGPQYSGLELPLILVAGGFVSANVGVVLNIMNNARGWLSFSWLYLPLIACWAAAVFFSVDFSDINDVSVAFFMQGIPAVLMQSARAFFGMRTMLRGDASDDQSQI